MVSFDSSQLFPAADRQKPNLAHKNLAAEIAEQRNGIFDNQEQMKKNTDLSSLLFLLCFFSSIHLLLVPGLADSSATSDSSKDKNAATEKSSGGWSWSDVLLLCLGLVVAGAISVLLFKLWQRKKREEQHARLLKLFEQDDELEMELGLRD